MNALEKRLSELNPGLLSDLNKTVIKVEALLREYKSNFPTYTDHSISHTREVFNLASRLLTIEEINNLNDDEIYILSMASYLHDIGMCIPANRIEEIGNTEDIIHYKKTHPDLSAEDFIRNIHHELSNKFILEEWEALNIPDENYAKAIGLVAMGHRKVELDDIEIYDPNFFVKSGGREDFVCLPFLASVLRIADELDITNIRTPNLLTKYYKPEIEKSRIEWEKHIATTKINFKLDQVTYEVKCSNQNMLAALNYQFDKIRDVISSCQKVIRGIGIIEGRNFKLTLTSVVPKFSYVDNFKPEGIKFSFNVKNVISAFIGEDLYQDRLTALREAIQNSIDSCRYKYFKLKNSTYTPNIKVYINDELIRIEDNGMGMDKFIIENYFGKLANSFYAQDKIKNEFEAIGQFGVGVFSYFLIAEYLEIETKTENGDVQKFLIDKDPDNYFHFFNKAERNESGTTITLYLKKDLIGLHKYEQLKKYIRNTFRFIEFPIEIINNENRTTISQLPLKIKNDKIQNKLEIRSRKHWERLKTINVNIEHQEFEGEFTLVYDPKIEINSKKAIHSHFDISQFKTLEDKYEMSQIAISQKGVFVNNYSSSFLRPTLGNLNLRKKLDININRNKFSDIEKIHKIMIQFEVLLVPQLISHLSNENQSLSKIDISDEFLENYFQAFSNEHLLKEFYTVFRENIYIRYFDGSIVNEMAISDLIDKYTQFILITNKDDHELIYNTFKIPVIITTIFQYSNLFYSYLNIFNKIYSYNLNIVCINGIGFQKLTKDIVTKKIDPKSNLLSNHYLYNSQSIDENFLLINPWVNKPGYLEEDFDYGEIIFNNNHPFLQFIFENAIEIEKNAEYLKIIYAVLNSLSNIEYYKEKNHESIIEELNDLMSPLTKIGTVPKLGLIDFPKLKPTKIKS